MDSGTRQLLEIQITFKKVLSKIFKDLQIFNRDGCVVFVVLYNYISLFQASNIKRLYVDKTKYALV